MPDPRERALLHHLRRTLRLAWPMVLSRVGIMTMNTIDVVVLGRAGADELAHFVLGQAVYESLIGLTLGLLLGVPVLVAREAGAGNDAAAGAVWRRGLAFAFLFGFAAAGILQFADRLFLATGQGADLAAHAGMITATLAVALPFIAAYYVSASLLEALQRPQVALVAIALANLGNLVLNLVLVLGPGPFPALGAFGCALATVINFALLSLGTALYVRFVFPGRHRYGLAPGRSGTPVRPAEQARIGLAAGASFWFEVSAFSVLALFVGRLGTAALAAHGVLFQFLALTFMIAYGIAGATQVRVGDAWGRGDRAGMAMVGWTGLGLAITLTALVTALYAAFPAAFVGLFTDDAAVVAAAVPVMGWLVLATVFDGGQTVMNSACRGRGDAWMPTFLHFGSYWLVMVPLAWTLAISAGHGLAGIFQAILVASIVSLGVLSLRFRRLSRAAR